MNRVIHITSCFDTDECTVKVCPHIEIRDYEEITEDYNCEYKQTGEIYCSVCERGYRFVDHIN